jgi:hypothetical protein
MSMLLSRAAKLHRSMTALRMLSTKPKSKSKDPGSLSFTKAGLPLLLFSVLGVWVVANGIEGRNKERDTFQGRISKCVFGVLAVSKHLGDLILRFLSLFACRSERQAVMEKEHDDMMDKLSHIVEQDFDNTKRIERPEDILARRRKEREIRNVWYKRWGRWFIGRE